MDNFVVYLLNICLRIIFLYIIWSRTTKLKKCANYYLKICLLITIFTSLHNNNLITPQMFNLLKLFELCMREKKQIFIKFNTNLINSQTLEKPTRHLQSFFFFSFGITPKNFSHHLIPNRTLVFFLL